MKSDAFPMVLRPVPLTPPKSVNPEADAVPSIVQQTPWRAGFFNFGKAQHKDVDYFNCGLADIEGVLWLIVRRSIWTPHIKVGLNDLMAFKLSAELIPQIGYKIQLSKRFENEHFEDPRAMVKDGKLFVSCCDFVIERSGWTGAHQIICEVGKDWRQVTRFDPDYGKNGNGLGANTGHEKNWLWFWVGDRPHLVYSANPHIIAEFDPYFRFVREWKASYPEMPWKWGQIRGGTPPVLVDDACGEYWTFFHSSTPWRADGKRVYHMGAYSFQSRPPFRVTRITTAPLLSGSRFDRWAEGKPLVVFPGNALLRDGKWLVVGGSNDLDCFWIEIPHDELLSKTQFV